jgi:predicted porin
MGKTVLFASAFDGSRKGNTTTDESASLAKGNADISGFQLGAVHNLSKRTAVYAIYGNQEIKGKGALSANKIETTNVSAGVRHSF